MAIEIFNERTDPSRLTLAPLRGRTVAVIGYGNQGHAQALCLRDRGVKVVIGVRDNSASPQRAKDEGFTVHSITDACRLADLAIIALPDESHREMYATVIEPPLRAGVTIGFLHGFSIRFGLVRPRADLGVVMVAPKGPGTTLRQLFLEGHGLPSLLAVHQESPARDAESLAFAWAAAIGAGRSGVIRTTFAAEAETDLFGEQSVLCGGALFLMMAAFETLVKAGYEPELAYLECCHELKQVADLLYSRGPAGMMQAISTTAEFGAWRANALLADSRVREFMNRLLESIQSGDFAKDFEKDARRSFADLNEKRAQLTKHRMELASATIRSLMPWLDAGKAPEIPSHSLPPT